MWCIVYMDIDAQMHPSLHLWMNVSYMVCMGGHKKQGSERGSTDRERVWKPRRALNQVELILRPFSLVKIFFFSFQVCHLLWKTTKSVYSALGRRACFSSLNRGEYWPTMIPPCCWFRQGLSKIEVTLLFCPLPDPFSWICESLSAYSL